MTKEEYLEEIDEIKKEFKDNKILILPQTIYDFLEKNLLPEGRMCFGDRALLCLKLGKYLIFNEE